jgi:chemosensory pili system protein ChpA (sensor histidine kinase/response regulator)
MRQIAEISFDLAETQGELAALDRGLAAELARSGKLLKGLRTTVGRTRMLSLARLFQRFRRRVERFARDEGRPVAFEVRGEKVELDTVIVERISEPLLHLINNALHHGIESPAERRAAGKPVEASLLLSAHLRGAFVDLEVEDDGRGLAAEELRRRAVALGLRSEAEVQALSEAEALELIFVPGFSTAREVSETAGRGIGMDVVRSVVAELNGQVTTETIPGQGTRFTLRLPVTLVVSTALGMRVGGEIFALPTLGVRRLLQVGSERVEVRDGREWVEVDGQPVEVIHLADALELGDEEGRGPLQLVVVQVLGREVALAVDELLGIEEVVIKDLGDFLAGLPGFSGVTVATDGRVVLILDPSGLPGLSPATRSLSSFRAAARGAGAAPSLRRPATDSPAALPILLADDSISVRKVLGRQLTSAGYEVVAVQDGEQALEALRERSFAALITDLEMPRLNGFELLDIVRRRPGSRGLPTIVITTRAGRKHREQATRLGASAYFSKPIDLDALLATLGAITAPSRTPGAFASAAPPEGRMAARR